MVASWLSFDEALWWISPRRCPALTIFTSLPMLKMEFDTDLWALNRKWTTFISWWPMAPTLHHGGESDWLFWCWWNMTFRHCWSITPWRYRLENCRNYSGSTTWHIQWLSQESKVRISDLVECWTLDIAGWWKDRLGFQHLQELSTLSLPVPVYLVEPAWPWLWLRYKIENRLRTVYVYPLLGRLLESLGSRHLQGWARRKDFFNRSSGAYNDHLRWEPLIRENYDL